MLVHPDNGMYQTMQWGCFLKMKKRKQILYILVGIITSVKWKKRHSKKLCVPSDDISKRGGVHMCVHNCLKLNMVSLKGHSKKPRTLVASRVAGR